MSEWEFLALPQLSYAGVASVRKLRVSGVGCFYGGTTCDFRPPPVTKVGPPGAFRHKASVKSDAGKGFGSRGPARPGA